MANRLSAYTQSIPGVTMMTPNTQFGTRQSPSLGGLGDPTATGIGVLDTAQTWVSANPLPVLGIIAFLLFTRKR